jgi:flavoprotein
MEIKNEYALATRTSGTYTEYTLVKNGVAQNCPFKSRIPVPVYNTVNKAQVDGYNQIDQNCTDSCPHFKIIEGKEYMSVQLSCGGCPVIHKFYPAKAEKKPTLYQA